MFVSACEAEMGRVKRNRASNVFDLIPDAMHALNERVSSTALLLNCFRRFSAFAITSPAGCHGFHLFHKIDAVEC